MGRPHRPLVAGAYYHVVARGNDRAPIVLDGEDRIVFFHLLRRIERRYGWRLHARCLMGNHYHLVVETPAANLDAGMRDLNGGYARAFNEKHGRKTISSAAATGRSSSSRRSSTRQPWNTSSTILPTTASPAVWTSGTGRRPHGLNR